MIFFYLDQNNQLFFFTDNNTIIFLFTQKLNSNHRVYRFQIILRKFPNLHIVWTSGNNLALPDALSRNTTPESLTRKTIVQLPQNFKYFLAKDETLLRLECK